MNLYLCGFQGVGKTYFGKKIAKETAAPFYDVDEQFLELDGGNHTTIRDLYTTLGKEHFRKKEEKVVCEIVKKGASVVALGGGSLESSMTQRLVGATGTLVYLMLSKERLLAILETNIEQKSLPAYIDPADPIRSFDEYYEKRHALFSSLSRQTIDLEQCSNSEVVAKLQEIWQQIQNKEDTNGEQ